MIILIVFYFLVWTLLLYWIHRVGHYLSLIKKYHFDHHRFISSQMRIKQNPTSWHWSNLLLFNDTWKSTVDLWITEVIPTLIFSAVTGQWWIIIFYYFWAAIIQETIEHNPDFNIPLLSSGKWHLQHHHAVNVNYGLFFPLWDIVFKTYKPV